MKIALDWGMTFVPHRIIKNQDSINILSALHIVQEQTGMQLIKGFKTCFNICPCLLTSMSATYRKNMPSYQIRSWARKVPDSRNVSSSLNYNKLILGIPFKNLFATWTLVATTCFTT